MSMESLARGILARLVYLKLSSAEAKAPVIGSLSYIWFYIVRDTIWFSHWFVSSLIKPFFA